VTVAEFVEKDAQPNVVRRMGLGSRGRRPGAGMPWHSRTQAAAGTFCQASNILGSAQAQRSAARVAHRRRTSIDRERRQVQRSAARVAHRRRTSRERKRR